MGVPGFFAWLLKNKKKLGGKNLILNNLDIQIKWLMLDTNCLLHPCVANILEKYNQGNLIIDPKKDLRAQIEQYIWEKIKSTIDNMIAQIKPDCIYIGIDGVAPMGKILQQRQRRYRFLYDKKIKLNMEENQEKNSDEKTNCITKTTKLDSGIEEPVLPLSSIELTPGTDYMERINKRFDLYIEQLNKQGIRYVYSSYHDEGEGEHKILQYIKKNLSPKDSIVIYGLDADLLFLSLGLGYEYDLYVMREKQIFVNKQVDMNLEHDQEYNYVEIKQLHQMISSLNISTNDFIVLCYLIGNDFLPGLLTTDVKKGGLDKIFRAWDNFKEKKGIYNELDEFGHIKSHLVNKTGSIYSIQLDMLRGVFSELVWTEKYVWTNINRDRILNQENLEPEELEKLAWEKQEDKKSLLNKFIQGTSSDTDFLEKIEFNSQTEYYSYYLGVNCLDIDKTIQSKMVNDYISGIKWCISYYLNECIDWTWGYNFMITPTIRDIIGFFPQKNISNTNIIERTLNPVEQLILAIPPQTYHYVIEPDIIKKIKANKNIGYMLPESFGIDVNKEHIFWKCQVKIPMVEYAEFNTHIKKIKISNEKNKIYGYKKNF